MRFIVTTDRRPTAIIKQRTKFDLKTPIGRAYSVLSVQRSAVIRSLFNRYCRNSDYFVNPEDFIQFILEKLKTRITDSRTLRAFTNEVHNESVRVMQYSKLHGHKEFF